MRLDSAVGLSFWLIVIGLATGLLVLPGPWDEAWPADENVAWQKAERWGDQEPGKPYVLFMHGCTGIAQSERNWGRVLATLGYSVVMPDSLARPSRVQACDPRTASIKMDLAEWKTKVLGARHEEIAYALAELGKLQPTKLFLMGHSEGGFAVSTWTQGGFDAYVVSGTNCRGIRTEAGRCSSCASTAIRGTGWRAATSATGSSARDSGSSGSRAVATTRPSTPAPSGRPVPSWGSRPVADSRPQTETPVGGDAQGSARGAASGINWGKSVIRYTRRDTFGNLETTCY